MARPSQVASPPSKPVMVYDGDCRFCALWIRRWAQMTGEGVDYLPLQDPRVALLYPELPRERLETAVHFIDTGGAVYEGAEAVFRSLATNPSRRWWLHLYQGLPLAARASERAYRLVARHRSLFSWLTRIAWGRHVEPAGHFLVRRTFLAFLGAIYLIAFLSLRVQITGLVGSHGILPAAELMAQARHALDASGTGLDRYRLLPTLCWFGASDGFLRFQCAAGATLALVLMAGVWPRVCLALLWLLYLSLVTVGGDFLAFQWDNLLLETGLLAIFFAPGQVLPRPSLEKPPSRTALWLLRLLLFKLVFLSGVVKLASGDETWRGLTALTHHYQTQPLPTWVAWYAQQLPRWFQTGSCAVMFVIELAVPFLIFAPRRLRLAGGAAMALLQVLIALTGNYTFFNGLTLGLCLLLCDDFVLARRLPRRLTALYSQPALRSAAPSARWRRWRLRVIAPLAVVVLSISALQLLSPFARLPSWTSPVVSVYRWLSPLRSVNSYGLFAVMTTDRLEIIVEGSRDGRHWKEYAFRYKPGDPSRRPAFVEPHQPRLDWQMWFAALGNYRQKPMVREFLPPVARGLAGGAGPAAERPLSGPSSQVRPRPALPLSVHVVGGAQTHGRLVATGTQGRISAAGLAGHV